MHQYAISSSQGTTASEQQLDQITPRASDEAATRSPSEPIRSEFNVNPVFRSGFDPVPAANPSPAPDADLETSEQLSSSERTRFPIEQPPLSLLGRRLRWKPTWRIPVTILGFYFISFLCAATHYCFFTYLDGRIIYSGSMPSTKTTTIPQAYATTVSLLLVTAFRAALVASIGTCYTQYLWATFRKRVLKISLIEDLFRVQTNPLRFLNYQLYFKTPILVAVAIYCWLVPIATLYPPGTLVVGLQASSIDKTFNVSVFHHRTLMDISEDNVIAHIRCYDNFTDNTYEWGPPSFPEATENVSLLETCNAAGLTPDMNYIIRSNLIVGEISRLKQPSKENTSYDLNFLGTTLDCETTNGSMESTVLQLEILGPPSDNQETIWEIQHPEPNCELRNNVGSSLFPGNSSITYRVAHHQDTPRYWPCLDKNRWMPTIDDSLPMYTQEVDFPGSGIHLIVPITETVCRPKIVRYHITISHTGGAQHISYLTKDEKSIPAYTADFNDFNGSFEQWARLSDTVNIYQDFAWNLNQSGTEFLSRLFEYPNMSSETKPYATENGTIVETCVLESDPILTRKASSYSHEVWPLGVFEQRLHERDRTYEFPAFDSAMANELLINTTISALSLNQRFDAVNGTETRTFNVYRFENKLAFFLPYGLLFALAIPILALGFIALYVQNHGVSAINGGFVQLLMTTTGRNSLEAVVTKGSGTLGGYENVSKELLEMEVTFGELIEVGEDELKETDTLLSGHEGHADVEDDDSLQSSVQTASGTERCENSASVVRRAGFGTIHEVGPFRKEEE